MKGSTISILAAIILISGIFFIATYENNSDTDTGNNVSIVNDQQIIEISARGGYFPRTSFAKAGIPTTIKVTTNGTYDCSAALVIPSIGYQKFLAASGVTNVEIPPQKSGTTIQGFCSMGMYNFDINFS